MLSSFLSYLCPTPPPVTPRTTILDLPFEILEEILSIVLLLPSPPNSSSSSRTACLRTCKAFNSAGERQLFRSVSVSRESSWRMLFGPGGLFSRERGRNLARFVGELSLGGSTHWLWQLNSSSVATANSPFMISSSLDPFPSLTSLILQTSILSQLSHPSHIHPLDHLLPQLQLSKPFTLTLVTYGPSSNHASPTSSSPRLPYFSSLEPFLAFPDLVEIALPPLPDRHALYQALGFSSPPWTSTLDTLVFEGGPILEALNFRRRGKFLQDPHGPSVVWSSFYQRLRPISTELECSERSSRWTRRRLRFLFRIDWNASS